MRSRTQLVIAFFSAMAVTLVAVSDLGRTSPGPLSGVHQREPDLAGRNDCSECHGGLFGTLREACLECHEPIAAQLEGSEGLHGTLGARAEQCGLCHAEHHGPGAPLVHGQSFALAGVARIEEFDHALLGFVLDGAHSGLACSECHAHADDALLPRGEQRYLGLSRDCASCHEDPHEGRMRVACAACHGQAHWETLASEGHERFLPLVGGHGDLECTSCHAEGDPHALERVGRKDPAPPVRDCVTCHESPHTDEFTAGAARLAGLAPGAACVACHEPEHDTFHARGLLELSAEQHAASGFALDAPHAGLQCEACHSPTARSFGERYPGRAAERCSVCHEDVHEGQFETGPFATQECSACHKATRFVPHAFTAVEHARTGFELNGTHLEIECEACHEKEAGGPRRFRGTPSDCEACHDDAHRGFFEPFLAGTLPPPHGQCELCHDASSFAAAAEGFDHAAFTGFATSGAHAQTGCSACHESGAQPDSTGRTFGFVLELFGDFEGCSTCHADPHGGRFEDPRLPAFVETRADCGRCHVESSFRVLPRGFDHGFWTGFALAGAHAEAACSACHEPFEGSTPEGRTSAPAAGASCADCHEDPHMDQFGAGEESADCARCHTAAKDDFLSFDHERDSHFPLGEAHESIACNVCHRTEEARGETFVRYRPLGRECVDCHGTSAEVRLRRLPRK